MSKTYAFLKNNEDGTWNVVIVGNVVDGCGEVLTALLHRPKDEIDDFVAEHCGSTREVYRQPTLQ